MARLTSSKFRNLGITSERGFGEVRKPPKKPRDPKNEKNTPKRLLDWTPISCSTLNPEAFALRRTHGAMAQPQTLQARYGKIHHSTSRPTPAVPRRAPGDRRSADQRERHQGVVSKWTPKLDFFLSGGSAETRPTAELCLGQC